MNGNILVMEYVHYVGYKGLIIFQINFVYLDGLFDITFCMPLDQLFKSFWYSDRVTLIAQSLHSIIPLTQKSTFSI